MFNWFIVTKITGIDEDLVKDKLTFNQISNQLLHFINYNLEPGKTAYFIAHNNEGYDKIMFNNEDICTKKKIEEILEIVGRTKTIIIKEGKLAFKKNKTQTTKEENGFYKLFKKIKIKMTKQMDEEVGKSYRDHNRANFDGIIPHLMPFDMLEEVVPYCYKQTVKDEQQTGYKTINASF